MATPPTTFLCFQPLIHTRKSSANRILRGVSCIPAPVCKKALADASAKWPDRDRASDGICGDEAHKKRKSDHNSGNAFDLTSDPRHGVDGDVLVANLVRSNDPRIKYIIWERRIWYPAANGRRPQGWSAYAGTNPHDKHFHVSIKPEARNDLRPWPWSPNGVVRSTLRRGDRGTAVQDLQRALGMKGAEVDGVFGDDTELHVREFQAHHGLTVDGIAGKKTNEILFEDRSSIIRAKEIADDKWEL